jgi:hypothetical protein
MHEFWGVALVLKGVVEEGVTHTNFALLSLLNINVILELLKPHPIVDILRLNDTIFSELLDNIDIVDYVKN